MRQYFELPGLEHLYLEDSFVLGVRETDEELRFEVEGVLTEGHPHWSPPKPGLQYTYLVVDLVFSHPRRIEWIAYIKRRSQQGKSSREATRCLKRYLARNLYGLLENGSATPT